MTKADKHRAKWHHNRDFACTIDDRYSDWMVVVVFYAALHAVQVLFIHEGVQLPSGHRERHGILKRYNRYRPVWEHYRKLHSAARVARYEVEQGAMLDASDVKCRVADYLYKVEQSVQALTGDATQLPRIWP